MLSELSKRHIFVDASCCFIDASHVTRHRCVFCHIFSSIIAVLRHTSSFFLAFKTCFNADTDVHLQMLAVNPTPSHLVVILDPSCWWSNSPLPAQWSSSNADGGQPPSPPSAHLPPLMLGGQIPPSPPGSHPPPLLAVKLTPFCPAVILHPCWRPTSSIPTQRSSCRRSTSPLNPAVGVSKG